MGACMGSGERGRAYYDGGINFRGSEYYKPVCLGKRRVKEGECCAIWDSEGACRLVEGPVRTCIFNSDVRFLDRFSAQADEYLKIVYRDGRRHHIRWPCSMFMNPVDHDMVAIQ